MNHATDQPHQGVWILAEQQHGRLQRVSFELLTRGIELARQRNTPLTALLIGPIDPLDQRQELIDRGADRVLHIDAPQLAHFLPQPYTACAAEVIRRHHPEIIIAGATSLGRTLMPCLAVKLNTGLTADCTHLAIDPDTGNLLQTRPAIGGNIMATIQTPRHRPQMATVRPRSTPPAPSQPGREGTILSITPSAEHLHSDLNWQGITPLEHSSELAEAEIVIAVGRGIKKADNLPMIVALAEQLNAAVGATRDVVDRGWLSYPHQIGLSGHTVSPRLYIAIGLSGSIQHIAGMQTAERIIAINSDPQAPIFKIADLGIVGDLFEIVPAITNRLRRGDTLDEAIPHTQTTTSNQSPAPPTPATPATPGTQGMQGTPPPPTTPPPAVPPGSTLIPDHPASTGDPAPAIAATNHQRSPYHPIDQPILAKLQAIVGEPHVITGTAEKLEPWSHDETPDRRYAAPPEAVVRPGTTAEVAAIMQLANQHQFPVTPRGAGSGLSGGAVPIHGGVVLLMDRMTRIIETDPANMTITVEPGVITNDINEQLKPHHLFYAGYPMSGETCSIGGNVAENAGGGKAVKYGVTSRYLLGLEVVTPAGEIVEMGGKLIKDVTGYNLIPLMAGSEGTLGIFTKVTLKLLPLPRHQVDLLALFPTARDALEAVPGMMIDSGIIPTAIEFMDHHSVKAACDYLNETLDYKQAGGMLIITVDGSSAGQVEAEYDALAERCLKAHATDVFVADNPTTSERIWAIRRNIGEACNLITRRQSNEDLVVPPAAIADMIDTLATLAEEYGVWIPCFGHAGDGNIHARIVSDPAWSDEHWHRLLPTLLDRLYRDTARLGGRLSGEHGIGHKRKGYMHHVVSEEYLDMIRTIKKALDPNNILNPGKIVDLSP